MISEHEFSVEMAFEDIIAHCSCGWERDGFRSRRRALDAWDDHCDWVDRHGVTRAGPDHSG